MNRSLTTVGVLIVAAVVLMVYNNLRQPQPQYTTSNHSGSFIKTAQVPQEQEEKKYQVSIQLDPVFPDSE